MATQSWTPKRERAKSRRKIEAARKQLLGIAEQWGDVDNYIVTIVDETIAALDTLNEALNEAPEEEAV